MDADTYAKLRRFAFAQLAADRYPHDHHHFYPKVCETCGGSFRSLIVTHHTGSRPGNFRGDVLGHCAACGSETVLFYFTGADRAPQRREEISCVCGRGAMDVAVAERIEGDEGLPGFFDEGVVVAHCAGCDASWLVVAYD